MDPSYYPVVPNPPINAPTTRIEKRHDIRVRDRRYRIDRYASPDLLELVKPRLLDRNRFAQYKTQPRAFWNIAAYRNCALMLAAAPRAAAAIVKRARPPRFRSLPR